MTATPFVNDENRQSSSSDDADSLVNVSTLSIDAASPLTEHFEHISHPSSSISSASSRWSEKKARLLYCKRQVAIHPTAIHRDNVSGYLGIVEVDSPHGAPGTGGPKRTGGKELLVTWVPNEMLERMDEEDREGYKKVEGRFSGTLTPGDKEEDGFVFVSVPPPKGEKYAFSVLLSGIYSILVYPPSLSHWYGSATINLMGGISLPTLFFHDDESPLLTKSSPPRDQNNPRSQWGFPPFLTLLQFRSTLLRSRLLASRQIAGAELWLVNPSKADREVHENGVEEQIAPREAKQRHGSATVRRDPYPPKVALDNMAVLDQTRPRQTIMTGLSNITTFSRKMGQQILSHPLAQPVVPHLPPAVRSLINVPGEWERSGRLPPKTGRSHEVASEFESARLYLARWARVVAEEGERARRTEVASHADLNPGERVGAEDLASSLGVFSLLASPNSKRPIPHPTRTPQHPITARDWSSFAAQGRDELWVRREIFKRGFSDSIEPEEQATRREGWEVVIGSVPWAVGGIGGGEAGKERRRKARTEARVAKREEFARLQKKWRAEAEASGDIEAIKEEWHRIDVDCRRTDRNQPIFAVPANAIRKGDEEKEAGGAGYGWDGKGEEEEGGAARLNPHIAALRTILMTYHTFSPALGYVQGMSDLLSPIYVVFDCNEADAFWGLVGVMRIMESNFLRDQSGMKRQLSTLQQLIGVMDPELYAHLDRTDSLNLFFCFRWILIAFKREFKFTDVIRLWEILWTNHYSNQFILFVALAILQSHRDVLLRYLTEFDEVLKYANDLSGTIDLDTTLAQAEVLFLSFRNMVEDLDRDNAAEAEEGGAIEGLRKRRGSGVSLRGRPGQKTLPDDLRDLLISWRPEASM